MAGKTPSLSTASTGSPLKGSKATCKKEASGSKFEPPKACGTKRNPDEIVAGNDLVGDPSAKKQKTSPIDDVVDTDDEAAFDNAMNEAFAAAFDNVTDTSSEEPKGITTHTPNRVATAAAVIPCDVQRLYQAIKGVSLTLTCLPDTQDDNGATKPYTAEFLTYLYIHAYSKSDFAICDLVVDTWIRAFQDRARSALSSQHIWLANPQHVEREQSSTTTTPWTGFPRKPKWQRDEPLPALAKDVTEFHPVLIDALYTHTLADSGARMVFADAMALCGDRYLASLTRPGEHARWHPEFIADTLVTALRLVRSKTTLEIEKTAEGAWCARYHGHSGSGGACYRVQVEREEQCETVREARPDDLVQQVVAMKRGLVAVAEASENEGDDDGFGGWGFEEGRGGDDVSDDESCDYAEDPDHREFGDVEDVEDVEDDGEGGYDSEY